jgi:hypothetical protein
MRSALLGVASTIALVATVPASAGGPNFSYVPNSLVESTIFSGPWTLHQSTGSNPHDASGILPKFALPPGQTMPPYVGAGTPYAGYCTASGQVMRNQGRSLMQPYYFPFVRRREDGLEGFFDYRPRNQQEAAVSALSEDWGATWHFSGKALALNPYCPWDPTDPDNLNLNVNGLETPYGSSSANAGDNGLGHPVVLNVNGVERIYQLNRANGHIDSDQLVVHTLSSEREDRGSLSSLPDLGYVSPLASGGYPTLTPALATSGLQSPDAIMGAVPMGSTTAIVYVEKQLGADATMGFPACPSTPAFALTNLVNRGKARGANHDVTTVRVATTVDGIAFTDVGAALNLFDPTTTALKGTRYLGSGSIIPLADGRYGMFFGAGNCLDNDSDGFHYIGYAETVNVVTTANDLLNWTVLNALDNPILSTDRVVDPSVLPSGRPYPLNAPIVNVSGADALTAAQVAPFVPPAGPNPPPGGYNSNFFSGRVYDPQALYTDDHTLTVVFAGYNTPQPSNNLGDYRTIGRFQLRVPPGYFKRPHEEHDREH